MVLVFNENLDFSACFFFSLAKLTGPKSPRPVVTDAVFKASRLFIGFEFILDLQNLAYLLRFLEYGL